METDVESAETRLIAEAKEASKKLETELNAFVEDFNKQPSTVQWWSTQEDIVISGISGRFPECENIREFMEKLFVGIDMVTENSRRWEPGYEPLSFRGSRTGVFVGNSFSEMEGTVMHSVEKINEHCIFGSYNSMFANQLSYFFDFTGPSMTLDTACSSSLLALQVAVDAIRKGDCDAAIVGGANLTLSTGLSVGFKLLGMLSKGGISNSFDKTADGYVRSECVGAVLLQRRTQARRVYATVLHAKSNTNGYNVDSITYPNAHQQARLILETLKECNTKVDDVTYVESHGTGTQGGDFVEGIAIAAAIANNKKEQLLLGGVKSNCGHAEPASGIVSLAKVIIAMETGIIPGNLHYTEPNTYIESLVDGRMKIVDRNTKWTPGIVGINSFGFGGSNTHAILKPHEKANNTNKEKYSSNVPLLLVHSGRTVKGVENVFTELIKHPDDYNLFSLLAGQSVTQDPSNYPCRGYILMDKEKNPPFTHKKILRTKCDKNVSVFLNFENAKTLPLTSIVEQLYHIEVFSKSYEDCLKFVQGKRKPKDHVNRSLVVASFIEYVAFQLAFIDLLNYLEINCIGMVNYPIGHFLCHFATGCMNRESILIVFRNIAEYFSKSDNYIESYSHNEGNDIFHHLKEQNICHMDKLLCCKTCLINESMLPGRSIVLQVAVAPATKGEVKNGRLSNNAIIMFEENQQHLKSFLKALGNLYTNGVNLNITKLYPKISYPVPQGTPMLSPLFDWDHSETYETLFEFKRKSLCSWRVTIDPNDPKFQFMLDHVIDGRCLVPFATYAVMVWQSLCMLKYLNFEKHSIIIEDINLIKPTVLYKPVTFNITFTNDGQFEIMDDEEVVAFGKVKLLTEEERVQPLYFENLKNYDKYNKTTDEDIFPLDESDFYKVLRLRGYDFGPNFRNVHKLCNSLKNATVIWRNNWITFIDCFLQTHLLFDKSYDLVLPIRLEYCRIDPIRLYSGIYKEGDLQLVDAIINEPCKGGLVCGVESYGLVYQTVSARNLLSQTVVMEWNDFAPYFNSVCLNEFPSIKHQLTKYNNDCSSVAKSVLPIMMDRLYKENDAYQQSYINALETSDDVKDISLLEFMQNLMNDLNTNEKFDYNVWSSYAAIFSRTEDCDPLLNFCWNYPIGVDILDICTVNLPLYNCDIAAVEPIK